MNVQKTGMKAILKQDALISELEIDSGFFFGWN